MGLYTIKVNQPVGRYHEIHRNLDIVKSLGLEIKDEKPIVYVSAECQEYADNFFAKKSLTKANVICIHPGASKPVRAWMPERFREISKRVVEQLGVHVVITWGKDEEELAHQVADGLDRAVVCERTDSVGRLPGIIKNSGLFFSNCTGPMNLAVAVGTPVVALLGSSHPKDWGAYGTQHINVKSPLVLEHYSEEDERKSMEMITVDHVWKIMHERWHNLQAKINLT